jgi:hypothetical protein
MTVEEEEELGVRWFLPLSRQEKRQVRAELEAEGLPTTMPFGKYQGMRLDVMKKDPAARHYMR